MSGKQACKFYLRGYCQYGEKCRYSHATQQQPKTNPFGFGQNNSHFQNRTQQQQNSSGGNRFGVFNNFNSNGSSNVDSKHQKPFENKWSRFSPIPASNSSQTRQSDSQSQVATHNCADRESCKKQIIEDFEHERPLWKLTCYAHWKHLSCDIVGDVSYEELRAAAYDSAKQGLSLQSIIQGGCSHVIYVRFNKGGKSARVTPSLGNNGTNTGVSVRHGQTAPSNTNFGQPSPFQFPSQNTTSNNNFVKPSTFQVSSQTPNSFGTSNMSFGTQGFLGSHHQPTQTQGNAFSLNFGNSVTNTNNQFPVPMTPQFPINANNQSTVLSISMDNKQPEGDMSIWLKENWDDGEIPEGEPPSIYC
ncbi:hypothetical protein GIB67_028944 [Kingdonia uniflora]|uniref:C3H1-type domain-containing protein n=1 Tax=Kingdonia uniflora TaxID=39325 RepID=A0A7J7LC27_9MAGN|nr:hypothetical protein GIB67_028944 [Kingdonia uniflora]